MHNIMRSPVTVIVVVIVVVIVILVVEVLVIERIYYNADFRVSSVIRSPERGDDNAKAYIVGHLFELSSDEEKTKYGAAVTNTVDLDQCFIDRASDTLGILQANLARMTRENQPVVVESLTKNTVGQQSSDESGKKGSCVGSVSCNSSQAARKENDGATAVRSADHAALDCCH